MKLCGVPYLIVVDWSGNGLSWSWKKHRTSLTRLFSKNLIMFGTCVKGHVVTCSNLVIT